jgi:putative DNA primase/helicase
MNELFDRNGIKAISTARAILKEIPLALTLDGRLAAYRDGVYRPDPAALPQVLTRLLGERYRPTHRATVEEVLTGLLADHRLSDEPKGLLNVRNGFLRLATGQLEPHDPKLLSSVQLNVTYDPTATCPAYETWLQKMIPNQVDDLEETVSQMLDRSRTPGRALFAYGPSHSGKSTFLRIVAAIAGVHNVSSVTLHALSDARFAAAELEGKAVNVSADLSSDDLQDVSTFKMLTGGDPVMAERKFGQPFSFVNRALLAFSANALPSVSEASNAYLVRMRPCKFGQSFIGQEDQSIEDAMMAELSGIFNRLLAAYARLQARGRPLPIDQDVRHEFEVRSDRVRQFFDEACLLSGGSSGASAASILPPDQVSTATQLARHFADWVSATSGASGRGLGRNRLVERLTCIDGVREVRTSTTKTRGYNIIRLPETHWGGSSGSSAPTPLSRARSLKLEGTAITATAPQVAVVAVPDQLGDEDTWTVGYQSRRSS